MHPLVFDRIPGQGFRILCLGAHCDDIEIGCGGTVLRLLEAMPDAEVHWVVFTGSPQRQAEARASAAAFLERAGAAEIELHSYRESFLPQQWGAIKEEFERMKALRPALVLTHWTHDAHQDHRLIAELTWNTFRDQLIWEYEIPKYEGDLGEPNLFVPLPKSAAERKVAWLVRHFPSQQKARGWFDEDTFFGLMRLRGVGCNAASGYAEAFHCRKVVV